MAFRSGHEEWFQQTFAAHYKELVTYAHKYLYDRGESEDVVQEVYLQLWENRKNINIHTSTRSYLYTMVRNRCLNYLKSVKITDNMEVLQKLCHTVNDVENKEASVSAKFSEINRIVKIMPKSMREVFELKYLSNYTYTEIATELNISPNTVKTQLQRAKARILNVVHAVAIFLSTIFF